MSRLLLSDTGNKLLILFLYFFAFTLVGIIGSTLLLIVLQLSGDNSMANSLRITQVIQTTMMFILPAYFFARKISDGNASEWLTLNKRPAFGDLVVIAFTVVVSIPFNSLLYDINRAISFPSFMEPLQQWLWDRHNDDTIKTILPYDSIMNIIISLLIVGVVAGFAEEIFFRGSLQKIIYGDKPDSRSALKSIIITSLIFSAFHIDFYGFLPRFIIGGLFFGAVYWWTGTLWVTVWGHFFYNSTYYLLSSYFETNSDIYPNIEDYKYPVYIYFISTILFFASLGWFYYKNKSRRECKEIEHEQL